MKKLRLPRRSMKKLVSGGKKAAVAAERAAARAIKQAAKGMKAGARELKKAEKRGSLMTWKNRIGLGVQLVEVAMLATAAAKGLRVGKAAQPARRARSAKKRSARA